MCACVHICVDAAAFACVYDIENDQRIRDCLHFRRDVIAVDWLSFLRADEQSIFVVRLKLCIRVVLEFLRRKIELNKNKEKVKS